MKTGHLTEHTHHDDGHERGSAAEVLRVGRDELRIHVATSQSDGALLAAEVRMPAGGGPPLLHRHAAMEVYRVEDGELTFYLGDEEGGIGRRTAGAGEVVHIASEREHTIRNESDDPASAYVVYAAGAPAMEAFVREAAELGRHGPPAVEDVMAAAERHGIRMTRPVPAGAPA